MKYTYCEGDVYPEGGSYMDNSISNAQRKDDMTKGGSGLWMNLRYGSLYLVHKVLSVLISIGMATITVLLESQTLDFFRKYEGTE